MVLRTLCLVLIATISFSFRTIESESSGFSDRLYERLSWEEFARAKIVNQPIDLDNPDIDLINAAVFYASNQAREQQRMSEFAFRSPLRDMARYHAGQMARYHFVSHDNPRSPRYATVEARGKRFEAQVNAENVASTFLHRYEGGTRYYTKRLDGEDAFFEARSSRQIEVHTYWSFGQSIVQSWIDSPSHRRNLFHPQLKTLGCACEIGAGEIGSGKIPMVYCGQNFGIE